jgi:hypothetical protein
MYREATSKPAKALHCLRCGMAVPAHCSRCPRCGQPAPLRFGTHGAAPGGKLAAATPREPPRRPAPPPMTRAQKWASAALPHRLTAADPNGARRWGLSTSVAVVLFGYVLAFGTYVAVTERESAQEMWRMVEASRHAEEARTAARHSAREDSRDSAPSALSPDSSNSLVASLRQQIDSARAEAAADAARMNKGNDSMRKRGGTPRNASRSDKSGTAIASNSARQPPRAKGSKRTSAESEAAASAGLSQQTPKRLAARKSPTGEAKNEGNASIGTTARATTSSAVPKKSRPTAIADSVAPKNSPFATTAKSAATQTPPPATPAAQATAAVQARASPQASASIAAAEPAPAQLESLSLTHLPTQAPSLPATQVPRTESKAASLSPAPSVRPAPLAPRPRDEAAEASQPETRADTAPTRCDTQDASTCKTGTASTDSQTQRQTRTADRTTSTMQLGALTRQLQESVPPRHATTKQSAKSQPAERAASATPKSTVRHAHRRPAANTARRGPQTRQPTQADTPLLAQTGRAWRFEMPPGEQRALFSTAPVDIYRGH